MSHNPKAPWPRRHDPQPDRQHPRDAFANRLRLLGAADDVVADVVAQWDDDTWSDEDRAALVAMSDEALRAELDSIEREHYEGTHTEDEEAAERYAAAVALAEQVIGENVRTVIEWVDAEEVTDLPEVRLLRALAVLELEQASEKPRTTLIAHVNGVVEALTDAAPPA